MTIPDTEDRFLRYFILPTTMPGAWLLLHRQAGMSRPPCLPPVCFTFHEPSQLG